MPFKKLFKRGGSTSSTSSCGMDRFESDDDDSVISATHDAKNPRRKKGGYGSGSGGGNSKQSTSTNGGGTTARSTEEEEEEQLQLAKEESDAVFKLRMLVILVLMTAASAVSLLVYTIADRSERDEFVTQYEGVSEKIIQAFENVVTTRLGAISSLGVAAIAYSADQSEPWPFVRMSSFQQRSSTVRKLSGAFFVSINPLVTVEQRAKWEDFVGSDGDRILEEAEYQKDMDIYVDYGKFASGESAYDNTRLTWPIYTIDGDGKTHFDDGKGPYLPYSQTSPLVEWNMINQNLANSPFAAREALLAMETKKVVLGDLKTVIPGNITSDNFETVYYSSLMSADLGEVYQYKGDPIMRTYFPIFSSFKENREAAAVMMIFMRFGTYFENVLPPTANGIHVVLENTCSGAYTYEINGQDVDYLGEGDVHSKRWADMERYADYTNIASIADGTKLGLDVNQDYCPLRIRIYPAQEFYETYITNTPLIITFSIAIMFMFTILLFIVYDRLVERRQRIVFNRAKQTTAIVTSLFPKNITDRMFQEKTEHSSGFMTKKNQLKSFLNHDDSDDGKGGAFDAEPIADLIPHSTVLFADIAGFTAWSSTREPSQVFVLLQSVYQAFDLIAKRRKVFKVETIGDSYMAVTGLPDPQENHALIMARFARESLVRFQQVTRELEVTLGPDTADLAMRYGFHSGPVTAGVLRGERARFQLFGDTVNTASRMESTGQRNKIQVSEATAQLLINAGKSHWVQPREDAVTAKGKGSMKTYWLTLNPKKASSTAGSDIGDTEHSSERQEEQPSEKDKNTMKHDRLVDWASEIISEYMKKLAALRKREKAKAEQPESDLVYRRGEYKTHVDEIGEMIIVPQYDALAAQEVITQLPLPELDSAVREELHHYVHIISAAYRNNPFHNFEHACHVTMSVSKLLARINTADLDANQEALQEGEDGAKINDYTYGIKSDPLAHVAIIFSALIHDIDHRGISNVQLAKEEPSMSKLYRNQSIAEQNSLDVAWDILMTSQFDKLRKFLFSNVEDMKRFYQVLVNVVLATDIFDKDLNDLRKARWNKAFHDETIPKDEANGLRATIVIEHIIQASDVSHTMQHWHIYRKWNKRLFEEMSKAFREGRMGADPATFWYKGELGFFDKYVIPLAKKLRECQVFGVLSDEYLIYATKNRDEWAQRGEQIVQEMVTEMKEQFADSPNELESNI